jgi:cytochrome o ubiquinol oxidase operon protein cyoD
MSDKNSQKHVPPPNLHGEHGTLMSYVFGFVLSLEFTAIPYYLIINHMVIPHVSQLVMLMSFAVVQMLVQILFFLHLGRGPKPLYNIGFFVATVSMILVVTVGSIFIMSNLHARMSPAADTLRLAQDEGISQVNGKRTGACQRVGASHIVTIAHGVLDTSRVNAHLCDTLTLVSKDAAGHTFAFGSVNHPTTYGGETTLSVTSHHSQTITLNQAGIYTFYDHLIPSMQGSFRVTP